jgi:L,D-peptidoglycan transpeptidase YkuD (ErfK/YbiS/YcfS/YnhG family)
MIRARVTADGHFIFGRLVCRAALGRGGIIDARQKREGDGATPTGILPLRRILYRADRIPRPRAATSIEPIAPEDGFCDDPTHRDYNRMIRLPHEARHEELWRRDGVYDLVGILGWNDSPVERGRGSAIFLHVARPDFAPTEGCVALALADLVTALADGLTEIEVT